MIHVENLDVGKIHHNVAFSAWTCTVGLLRCGILNGNCSMLDIG